MVKASEINITDVTAEQISRCWKVFLGSEPVWMVQSEQDALKEYQVRYSAKMGFTCSCPAGLAGFSGCKAGYCKHVKWALAASAEEREAVAELNRAIAEQAAKPVAKVVTNVDTATLARIAAADERASSKPASKARPYEPRAFSLLR